MENIENLSKQDKSSIEIFNSYREELKIMEDRFNDLYHLYMMGDGYGIHDNCRRRFLFDAYRSVYGAICSIRDKALNADNNFPVVAYEYDLIELFRLGGKLTGLLHNDVEYSDVEINTKVEYLHKKYTAPEMSDEKYQLYYSNTQFMV